MKRALMLFALAGFASTPAPAQDPAKVAAKQCKVAFENDYVRILHWTVVPHEKTPMHEHPALVSVSIGPTKTRFTSADGQTRDVDSQAGQATWSDPDKHSSESIGDKKGEIVQVELKKKPDASITGIPDGQDAVAVDPKHYKVEFENDQVRVLRIHYGPGEKSVMHAHPAAVAVFLTEGHVKFGLPGGKTATENVRPGQAQWTDKQQHLPENAGTKPFELVLVELK